MGKAVGLELAFAPAPELFHAKLPVNVEGPDQNSDHNSGRLRCQAILA